VAIQTNNFVASSGVSSGSCAFLNPQTEGNANLLMVGGANFDVVAPTSIADTNGNEYTLVQTHNGETGGYPNMWVYVALDIKAGANTVDVVMSGNCGYTFLTIIVVEAPAASAVRASDIDVEFFTSSNPSLSLAGTVAGDYVCAFGQCTNNSPGFINGGDIAGTPANLLWNIYANGSGQFTVVAQDGEATGTPTPGTCDGNDPNGWTLAMVALVPAPPSTNDALFFGAP
jgi:hypothetical protein